jgi:hypothetical protein
MCIGDQQLWFGLNTKLLVKYFQLSMPEIFLKTKKKKKKKKKKTQKNSHPPSLGHIGIGRASMKMTNRLPCNEYLIFRVNYIYLPLTIISLQCPSIYN